MDRPLGFPVHAGMNRGTDRRASALLGVPRARGDEPTFPGIITYSSMGSPCTRG